MACNSDQITLTIPGSIRLQLPPSTGQRQLLSLENNLQVDPVGSLLEMILSIPFLVIDIPIVRVCVCVFSPHSREVDGKVCPYSSRFLE